MTAHSDESIGRNDKFNQSQRRAMPQYLMEVSLCATKRFIGWFLPIVASLCAAFKITPNSRHFKLKSLVAHFLSLNKSMKQFAFLKLFVYTYVVIWSKKYFQITFPQFSFFFLFKNKGKINFQIL